jgi:hypothetical protein
MLVSSCKQRTLSRLSLPISNPLIPTSICERNLSSARERNRLGDTDYHQKLDPRTRFITFTLYPYRAVNHMGGIVYDLFLLHFKIISLEGMLFLAATDGKGMGGWVGCCVRGTLCSARHVFFPLHKSGFCLSHLGDVSFVYLAVDDLFCLPLLDFLILSV